MAEEARRWATDEPTVQFPDDILIEIFLKLPVRLLLLLKLLSKHWLRLIENPHFIHLYCNRPFDDNQSNNPIIILRKNLVLTFLSDDQTLPYKDDVALEVLFPSLTFKGLNPLMLLGPCNGLFCITNKIDSVIFNPATKKCRKVSRSPLTLSPQTEPWYDGDGNNTYEYDCVGFGYESVSCDYKLVVINERLDANSDYPYRIHLRVVIYSLRANSWRDINRVMIADTTSADQDYYSFFNGALHKLYNNNILVFDLDKEDFDWFDLPCTYEEDLEFKDHLSVLNESLALIVHWERVDVGYEIWVMLEYGVSSSWTQLYNVKPDVDIERALSFSKKGEFILASKDGELASFDVKTMAIKLFNVKTRTIVSNSKRRQVERVPRLVDAFRYRESFVSLR